MGWLLTAVKQFYFELIRFYGDLLYPQLFLTSSSNLRIKLGTHGMNAPNTCSVVLVAGSQLVDLSEIMKQVDSLGQEMLKIPYAVVLLSDDATINLTTIRHDMSPAIVSTRHVLHAMLNFRPRFLDS